MMILRRKSRRSRNYGLTLLVASLLLLAACGTAGGGSPIGLSHATPTATIPAKWRGHDPRTPVATVTPLADAAPRPLPAFSDDRVAYIGPDSLLHAVSLDGKTNLAGTPIPLSGAVMEDGVLVAGTSPDGRQLAYYDEGSSQITVINAASGLRNTYPTQTVTESPISWTPDQRYLALTDGAIVCVSVATGHSFVTPGDPITLLENSPWRITGGMAGWLDATHAAVAVVPNNSGAPGTHGLATPAPASQTQITLESLDITTNRLRPISTLRGYGYVGRFSVLPGVQWTLFIDGQDSQQPITPFMPMAALINNTTGAVIRLPHLSALLPQSYATTTLWRPNSTQAIISGEFGQGQAPSYLIDAMHDTATPLTLPGFPVAWSPDGATLVTATDAQGINEDSAGWNDTGVVGAGPFTLMAVRIGTYGSMSAPVTLTTQAMDIPTLGFVHTA